MKIVVTQQHIDNGKRGSTTSDPVALALKDAGFDNPWVSPIRITQRGSDHNYGVPDSVLQFMLAFDTGKPVAPFTFLLPED